MYLGERMTEESSMSQVRCKGCGKPIESVDEKQQCEKCDDGVVHIRIGTVNEEDGLTEFEQRTEWGYMHRRCFRLAIGAPIV